MIRAGMTVAEAILQLTKGFRKMMGRDPDGLEKIKIQQEAVKRIEEVNKVVDMQGRTLDPSKTIMGGTQEGAALKSGIMNATGAKPIEARADISKYIKDGKPDNDKLNALVDRDMILKEEADSLATKGENYERFQQISAERKNIREIIEDVRKMFPEDMATGGRAGFKMGRRAFLKLMGGVGAGIGALKTGLLKLTGKEAAPQVVKEVVEQTTKSTPPPYFFELANKIKSLGKPDKVTYADRVEIHRYTGKNGDEYELVEDLSTGDMKITKDKIGGVRVGDDEMVDGIADRSVMEYKKGDVNVDPDKKIASKSPDEYDEYKVEFDVDGTEAEADDISEFIRKEIIEETTSEAPKIKKAGGGVAYMLGE